MKILEINPSNLRYLSVLQDIPTPPKKVFIRGKLPEDRVKTVAIVGTRKPTPYGKEIAQRLAYELVKNGVIVVSGMALGIDGIAHRAAIEGGGKTIAVLANGLDKFYPSSHNALGQKILDTGGAIISEYPEKTPALPHQFLERNRIVSGISDVVVVIEAASRSGTLSTASHALNQGKDVFAVPGNITSPLSEGCNKLIKMGANPLTDINEFVEMVAPKKSESKSQQSLISGDTDEEDLIINHIRKGIKNGDDIIKSSGMPASDFAQAVTMLEIKGVVSPLGGNNWRLN